ncbi:MAG: hypothetical protein A3J81_08325 [Nitrospirae bacterium RIFOXYB2_FULL_43_5]|nr:MAG: hypothetical protein A3J81_08325 [Nitrospirae bacterium RIFOXYB2_FULL_43_5]
MPSTINSHLLNITISAGRYIMLIKALKNIIPAMNNPTVTYGVSGANIMAENAVAKRMAFLIMPLPGRAAVQRSASVMSSELGN